MKLDLSAGLGINGAAPDYFIALPYFYNPHDFCRDIFRCFSKFILCKAFKEKIKKPAF
jgi:hypothetical protein